MLTQSYSLAVIDGVTDSLGVFGYKTKENDDISAWMRDFPKTIAARNSAAVVIIDHLTKSGAARNRYAIGGQAKMSSLTGAAYTVDVSEVLGRGLRGIISLRIGKVTNMPPEEGTDAGVTSRPSRPTDLMEKVSRLVEEKPNLSQNAIVDGLTGRAASKVMAVKTLVAEQYLSMRTGPRQAQLHSSMRPYRQSSDPESDKYDREPVNGPE